MLQHELMLRGPYRVEHIRDGKVIGVRTGFNAIVNEGKNYALKAAFKNAGTDHITSWCIGLINDGQTLAAADTYASHAGWTEFTAYTVGGATVRGTWGPGDPANQLITNATPITFDITVGASTLIAGICVVGGGSAPTTPGDQAGGGKLWATAEFTTGDIPVIAGDQIKVTYGVTA